MRWRRCEVEGVCGNSTLPGLEAYPINSGHDSPTPLLTKAHVKHAISFVKDKVSHS